VKSWREILVTPETSIRETIERIDRSALQVALVTDVENRLRGIVTDGDIRRGILRGVAIDSAVSMIMNPAPTIATASESRSAIIARMQQMQLRHIPVVDGLGELLGLETLDELSAVQRYDNIVVLMAGGLGKRLSPLTNDCPKPLLHVGGRPILETILLNFVEYGFRRFFISVHYKAEMVKHYFGDGTKWGIQIEYLHETKQLGTAGALGLLPLRPEEPIVVMNGDLLTKVNLNHLMDFHGDNGAKATMCVREYDFQVPYGVLKLDGHRIVDIEEKPVQRFFVNAGIYVIEPDALKIIPKEAYLDMPTFFRQIASKGESTAAFPIREYWLDIGQRADFDRAAGDFEMLFE
jgi:dTDP-glucose pyrophosphorylase